MSDISFQDIKKAYFDKAQKEIVQLCYSGKSIQIKPLKIKDKKEFLKYIEQDDKDALDNFIDQLIEKYTLDINEEPIVAKDLVEEEREQILMLLRKISSDIEVMDVDHICPACKQINTNIKFNFSNVHVDYFKKPEGMDDLLEVGNKRIKFQIAKLTRKDILDVNDYINKNSIKSKVEKEFIYLAATIKEIYLVIDDIEKKYIPKTEEKVKFVEDLKFDDFNKIKEYFEKTVKFGVKANFDFKCIHCQYEGKEEVSLANFFIN